MSEHLSDRNDPPAVPVPRPTDGYNDPQERLAAYHYLIESLIGGLDYQGLVRWLGGYRDLGDALDAADRLRGSVAT